MKISLPSRLNGPLIRQELRPVHDDAAVTRSFVCIVEELEVGDVNIEKSAKLPGHRRQNISGVLHKFRPIAKGLIIRQADLMFSRGRNRPGRPACLLSGVRVIMPRVSQRGLNFDLNASQYGVHNSAPAISFAFTRQMNHATARS